MEPSVCLIILNWNRRDLTLRCLGSVTRLTYPAARLEIVVVDNGSSDGTADAVRRAFPHVKVLRNTVNLGYAGGNNAGIRYALNQGADYVGLLNNDVRVDLEMLSLLVDLMEASTNIGVATPLVAEMDAPERVWALGSQVNWQTGEVTRVSAGDRVTDNPTAGSLEVDIASGAALLAKRDVFETVGLLDEAFYLYYEESDWCLRVKEAGYEIHAVPAARVWHKVSATLGVTSPLIDYYMLRNHLRFIARHWKGVLRDLVLARVILRSLMTVLAYTVKSHRGERISSRNVRLLALRDAGLGRWGKMGDDVLAFCGSDP